jgi:hypothetical protein
VAPRRASTSAAAEPMVPSPTTITSAPEPAMNQTYLA